VYLHHLEETDAVGKPLVGTATVFVSHAWNMRASDFFEATLNNMKDDDFAWIDMFMYTQYNNGDGSTEAWIKRFELLVGDIGRVVAIITPWEDPIALRRIWCLFELICAMRTGARLQVVMPKVEESSLRDGVLKDPELVMKMLTTIEFKNANATRKEDLNAIRAVVDGMERGSHGVDIVVHDYLRQWVNQKMIGFVEEAHEEGIPYAKLCIVVALICQQDDNHDKAIEFFSTALAIAEKMGAGDLDSAGNAVTYNNLGVSYESKGKYNKAMESFMTAAEIGEKVFGKEHRRYQHEPPRSDL
jgi:tetratricopeptide (TPR) repeat protein